MAMNEHSAELAGVHLAGQNHVCAFFNTMDDEHRVLRSFYKDGFDRGEKATHIVDSENREAYLKRLTDAGLNVQELMRLASIMFSPGTTIR
jgi:MEDS: MEthanogen/methylotroph, DcmR Sensory domain